MVHYSFRFFSTRPSTTVASPSSPVSAKRHFVALAGVEVAVEPSGRLHGVGFAAQYCTHVQNAEQ